MKGESMRQQKMSRLLLRELADIFQKDFRTDFPGIMVTFTNARVTADLAIVKCYVSVFPGEGKPIVESLNKQSPSFRYKLGNRMSDLRVIPEVNFYLDDSLDYIDKIDELLKD